MSIEDQYARLDKAKQAYRNAIIEECAKVAEDIWSFDPPPTDMYSMADAIAAAIRALKDKP